MNAVLKEARVESPKSEEVLSRRQAKKAEEMIVKAYDAIQQAELSLHNVSFAHNPKKEHQIRNIRKELNQDGQFLKHTLNQLKKFNSNSQICEFSKFFSRRNPTIYYRGKKTKKYNPTIRRQP